MNKRRLIHHSVLPAKFPDPAESKGTKTVLRLIVARDTAALFIPLFYSFVMCSKSRTQPSY